MVGGQGQLRVSLLPSSPIGSGPSDRETPGLLQVVLPETRVLPSLSRDLSALFHCSESWGSLHYLGNPFALYSLWSAPLSACAGVAAGE